MNEIITILNEIRSGVDWISETDIIESGLIDSFDMIALVSDLNDAFKVNIGLEHMEPDNFCSVDAIAAMLRELGAEI